MKEKQKIAHFWKFQTESRIEFGLNHKTENAYVCAQMYAVNFSKEYYRWSGSLISLWRVISHKFSFVVLFFFFLAFQFPWKWLMSEIHENSLEFIGTKVTYYFAKSFIIITTIIPHVLAQTLRLNYYHTYMNKLKLYMFEIINDST